MRTPETPLKLDFTGRAKTNDVAVARLIGFEAKEIADGRATVVLEAGPQHANPMGTLPFTTVELKINFFRPVWQALLRANGKVVRRGRSLGYVECEITDERGQLVAKAASTCLVLRGEEAKGR